MISYISALNMQVCLIVKGYIYVPKQAFIYRELASNANRRQKFTVVPDCCGPAHCPCLQRVKLASSLTEVAFHVKGFAILILKTTSQVGISLSSEKANARLKATSLIQYHFHSEKVISDNFQVTASTDEVNIPFFL